MREFQEGEAVEIGIIGEIGEGEPTLINRQSGQALRRVAGTIRRVELVVESPIAYHEYQVECDGVLYWVSDDRIQHAP